MFWGVICVSGKKYSQIVDASYHISMAALEPRDTPVANKQVMLLAEHKNTEYLLCTLEYDRVMQVNLDLVFKKGDDVTFFINGEGSVHVTGYLIDEFEAQQQQKFSVQDYSSSKLLDADFEESDEDDAEDWTPSKEDLQLNSKKALKKSKPDAKAAKSNEVNVESEDDDDEEEEEDDDDDDEEDEDDDEEEESEEESAAVINKRKKGLQSGNEAKRQKKDAATPTKGITPGKGKSKDTSTAKNSMSSKGAEMQIIDVGKDDSEDPELVDDEDASDSSEEDVMDTSIGRTPMPSKKFMSFANSPVPAQKDQNSASSSKKILKDGKSNDISGMKKKKNDKKMSTFRFPEETIYSKKLAGGVEVEDVRIGSGPIARPGKFVHITYVGRFPNNEIFDCVKDGSKPISFRLGRGETIKGLDIGLEGMKVGGKRKVKVPPQMGYGKKNSSIPPNTTLYFTVELKAVSH